MMTSYNYNNSNTNTIRIRSHPSSHSYGVAIYNFKPPPLSGPVEGIPLRVGELFEIYSESEDWYYGSRITCRGTNPKGIFPKSFVKLRECSVDRTGSVEIVSIVQPQIVQEITQTLREWGQHWKHLYVTGGEKFKFIEVSMRALLELRSSILSGTLPLDELKKVQRTAIYTIDKGNRELGMDLVVRSDTNGTQIDPTTVSACRLYNLHSETADRIKLKTELSSSGQSQTNSYTFYASIRNFVCKMSEDAELLMSLYDGNLNKHFTESYVVRWSRGGLASDIDQLHNLKVLFTDLGISDMKREKVYLVCYVVRIGGMEAQTNENRRSSVSMNFTNSRTYAQSTYNLTPPTCGTMRRPLGIATMDITHIFNGDIDVDDDKQYCITFFPASEKDNMDNLLKRIILNKDLKGDTKTGQGLWISVKLLHDDPKQEEARLVSMGNVSIARKMGFPEVILPGDARNDLYLCLLGGSFSRGSSKSSDRNIQVTVRVCDAQGERIPDVISQGSGRLSTEYSSVIYYHEDKPRWNEIFKICIPIEEFKRAHVVFFFKHRSSNETKDKAEKPFAFAYTPLMQKNGTTLNDTKHNLCVYKIDPKKMPLNDVDMGACYLSLPSQTSSVKDNGKIQKGFLSLLNKDVFEIETNLCSTKLTQNVELLGVLNWRDHIEDDSLRKSLILLQTVPGGEIMKFLQDILDALFNILTLAESERRVDSLVHDKNSYDCLVFECLLYLISLVSDRKFHHFQPVLDLYIKESFCETLAYQKLCRVLTNLVENVDKDDNDILLKTMKGLEHLMRFIVRSRQLHAKLTLGLDHQHFQRMFQDLLNSIVVMMKCDQKSALTSQGACIKYLPMCITHILQVFPDTQLTKMVGEILDVLPLERLTKQRLIAVSDLVQGPLFLNSRCRCLLLPHITKTLRILIQTNDETSRCGVEIRTKNRSVDKVARVLGASKHKLQEHRGYSEQLELCVKILGEILTLTFRKDIESTDEEFNHIVQVLLRTIIAAVGSMDRENPSLCQLVSVLLEVLRQMTTERYNIYIATFTNTTDLMSFLTEVQIVLRDLVERPVFIGHWADMINLQNNILLKSLKLSSTTLVEMFHTPFEMQVWSNWFHLAISFLTQPGLQLQKLTPGQRRRIVSHYGDMRTEAAYEIKQMWYNLGKYKIHFIPTFIGPFLEMSLIPEVKLREATIPLFFDMMQCEYYSSKHAPELYNEDRQDPIKGNFIDIENEIIQKLDILIEAGHGDSEWRDMFVSILAEEAAKDETMKESSENLVSVISKLLQTLLQYRELLDHSSIDYRMHATTTLLAFYSDINRREMYIRYVNKLFELHLECENWTEAALTLLLHTKLLRWSNEKLSDMLKSSRHPHCQTHRDLKDAIYSEIVHYLDKGKMWELALNTCKELAKIYDEEVFDYCHLSELHMKMSTLYMNIMKELRPQPEYFRVGYYGKGFPEFFQNKVFVYRGKAYERLQEFSSRITNGLPNAELMTTLTTPKEDVTESINQYVQVNAVEPIMSERNNKLMGKSISDKILKYHQHNNVRKFKYSRPFYRQDEAMAVNGEEGSTNEFANLWLERTELEVKEELPGILRWNVVIKSVTHEMSPLQVAVENMTETNKILKSLVIEHHSDPTLPLDPLTRKLNGMVDAAVMGGIVNYEKAFFTDEYLTAHPEHRFMINSLKDLIATQIPLLEFGIEVHRERLPLSLAPLHQRIAECFEKMKAHVHVNYGKKNCDLDKDISMVTMRRNISNLSNGGSGFHDSGLDRWSEISTQTVHSSESGIPSIRPQTSLRVFTSHINKQISRGSLTSGLSSGYSSFISPSSGIRSPVGSLLITPAKKREKERRRGRKSEVTYPNSAPITPSSSSQWYTSPIPPPTNQNGVKQTSTPTTEATSPTTVFELRQELTASRPLRSEVERERRLSQRPSSLQSGTNSNRNSAGTTDSNMSAEEDSAPPPLPQKTIRIDHHNLSAVSESDTLYQAINFMVHTGESPVKSPKSASTSPLMSRQNYDLVHAPRGSFLYSSLQTTSPLRKNVIGKKERAPTPPPKKKINSIQQ